LVQRRCRRSGAVLRRNVSRFFSGRGAQSSGGLSVRETGRCHNCPVHSDGDSFSFQIATETQEETDRYWNAIVGNGGEESACGWCKDKWGVSWQITPIALTQAITDPDPAVAKRAFEAMMTMKKIDIAAIDAARRG